MSISFAFFDRIWLFILTLVRSLLALCSFRRRPSSPFAPPRVSRAQKEAFVRAHARLRPILLTPRAHSTQSHPAASTPFLGHDQNESASVPQPTAPRRTFPRLDPLDPELGLSSNTPTTSDYTGPSVANVTSFGEGTTDASSLITPIGSLYVLPLPLPDRCYLAPISSTDCPYVEPLPTNVTVKPRLPGSPLKVSINADRAYAESMVEPIGSPPPRHWNPAQIWTSTPSKAADMVPDPMHGPPDHQALATMDPAMLDISRALIARSQNCMIQAYDDAPNDMSLSSDRNSLADSPNGPPTETVHPFGPSHDHYSMRANGYQPYPCPKFHHPDLYTYTWRRHATRLPGKANHYPRSRSHADLRASEWYDTGAYVPSPNPALSPPLHSPPDSDDEDEDEMPLGRLKARLAHRRSAALSASVGYGVPPYACAVESPRTKRRRSEGCLLAMLASSPTPIGLGGLGSRQVLSQALDADGYTKDWLEALSLRFSPEPVDAGGLADA